MWAGVLLCMGDHRLPKRIMPAELENAGQRWTQWTDCVADYRWVFGITGDWNAAALVPRAWYSTVFEGGCKFNAAWVRE